MRGGVAGLPSSFDLPCISSTIIARRFRVSTLPGASDVANHDFDASSGLRLTDGMALSCDETFFVRHPLHFCH
jgi:hypothetical protein